MYAQKKDGTDAFASLEEVDCGNVTVERVIKEAKVAEHNNKKRRIASGN